MMKKLVTLLLITVMAASLAACGKTTFTANTENEKNIVITAENAKSDSAITTGSLVLDENETLVIEPDIKSGSLKIKLLAATPAATDIDSTVDEILPDEASLDEVISAGEPQKFTLEAGSYYISLEPVDKLTGTITLKAEAE